MEINFYVPELREQAQKLSQIKYMHIDWEKLVVFKLISKETTNSWVIHVNTPQEIHILFNRINKLTVDDYWVSDLCNAKFYKTDLLNMLAVVDIRLNNISIANGLFIIEGHVVTNEDDTNYINWQHAKQLKLKNKT